MTLVLCYTQTHGGVVRGKADSEKKKREGGRRDTDEVDPRVPH